MFHINFIKTKSNMKVGSILFTFLVLLATHTLGSRAVEDDTASSDVCVAGGIVERSLELREKVREMMHHGFGSYMDHAWPWDELKPLTCSGRRWDRRERGTIDDVLGGFSLTLVDALDTLAVMGEYDAFFDGVQKVIKNVRFDRDVTVSLFETTIRMLGGLLSTHLLLLEENVIRHKPEGFMYDDELLRMAQDLGTRLLPAFETSSGIPYHRVNLRRGVEIRETTQTCTAAAGTLLLEFGLLSRLTGVPVYEAKARHAVLKLWEQRNPKTNLLGNTINVESGKWLSQFSGTGAGIDSYFEYLVKAWLLLDDPNSPYHEKRQQQSTCNNDDHDQLYNMFVESMVAVDQHLSFGPWHLDHMMSLGRGGVRNFHVSALQAFWPGLQATIGDIEEAKLSHEAYYSVWKQFGAFPETFDLGSRTIPHQYGRLYFLRPELIESTFVLYQKTRDPYYLRVGERIMNDIESKCRVKCGYAALKDVTKDKGKHEDRMDSFFLSETLKYLYMLFDMAVRDESIPTTITNEPHLFSTEGHLFFLRGEDAFDNLQQKWNNVTASSALNGFMAPKNATTGKENNKIAIPPKKVHGEVTMELVLTPYLETPIHVPSNADKQLKMNDKKGFTFASAEFGRPVDFKHIRHFLIVKSDPFDGCSPLTKHQVGDEEVGEPSWTDYVDIAHSFRLSRGEALGLAFLVERGGCSFVQKAANIGNATKGLTPVSMFVVNTKDDEKESGVVHTMVDDGTGHRYTEELSMVTSYMVPHSFGEIVKESMLLYGLPDPRDIHISHHLVVELSKPVNVKPKPKLNGKQQQNVNPSQEQQHHHFDLKKISKTVVETIAKLIGK